MKVKKRDLQIFIVLLAVYYVWTYVLMGILISHIGGFLPETYMAGNGGIVTVMKIMDFLTKLNIFIPAILKGGIFFFEVKILYGLVKPFIVEDSATDKNDSGKGNDV